MTTYRGTGFPTFGTGNTNSPASNTGTLNDVVIAFYATKPANIPASSFSDIWLGASISGSIAAGNDQGSMRSTAIARPNCLTSSQTISATFTGNNVTGGQSLRFSKDLTESVWALDYVGLEDQDESGTSVSATGTAYSGQFKDGDVVAIHVAIKSDTINHNSQSLTIDGCTLNSITWLSKSSSTVGGDLSMYLGYAYVTAGSSTGSVSYTASSSSSGGSATAVSLVRIREAQAPNPPTGLTATGDADSILLGWTAPSSGPTPGSYNVYRTHQGHSAYAESFNGTDQNDPGPNLIWTRISGTGVTPYGLGVRSNVLTAYTQNRSNQYRAEHDVPSSDMYSEIDSVEITGATSGSANLGLFLRASATELTYYEISIQKLEDNSAYLKINKRISGAFTELAVYTLSGYTHGKKVRGEVVGSTIYAFFDGVLIGQVTDTDITTGFRAGIATWRGNDSTTVVRADNFAFGSLSVGTVMTIFSGITVTYYDDTTAEAGITYTYTVRAVGEGGKSIDSNSATGTRLAGPPPFAAFGIPL